jgi:hypothetical protein
VLFRRKSLWRMAYGTGPERESKRAHGPIRSRARRYKLYALVLKEIRFTRDATATTLKGEDVGSIGKDQ